MKLRWDGKPLRQALGEALRWRWPRFSWGGAPPGAAARQAAAAQPLHRWVAALVGLLTVLLLALPGEFVAVLEQLIARLWPGSAAPGRGPPWADKIVHASLFTAWAWSLRRGWPGAPLWVLVALLLAAAGGTELLQAVVPGRTASAADVLADGAGICAGLIAANRLAAVGGAPRAD